MKKSQYSEIMQAFKFTKFFLLQVFKKTTSLAFTFLFVGMLLVSGCVFKSNQIVAEDPFTMSNWKQALELRNQERYELSYHYYTLALSSATSEAAIVQIKKEMEDMQRVIRSAR